MVLKEFGGRLVQETVPVPRPGVGEVLVRVVACGAGLTLENVRSGNLGGSAPRIIGHELSGTIAELGPGVHGWRQGDRVTASFYLFCGSCAMCASGRETHCLNFKGFIGAAVDGAFAEYTVLPAINLVRIPAAVPLREGGVIADAVATTYHVARERAKIVPGQRVAVIGAGGGVGIHMVAMAKAFGALVIAVERDKEKLGALEATGADAVVDSNSGSWREDIINTAGRPLDACIDLVGTASTTSAVTTLGVNGKFIVVGVPPNIRSSVTVDPLFLVNHEVEVTGSRYATRAEIDHSLSLVAEGKVPTVIGASYPLAAAEEALEAIRANKVFGRVIIDVATESPSDAR
ncbi:alcohol dehydrogenase catalytic domain-containing protein [Streptomyces sp. NPDC096311]|uniref:alcohol dehydrogenase catalytic domain-containing protein n=1 Tax=Streptomyces sp. NPDC096311 TaxID=3366083 RepID=UPI00381F39C8